MDREEQSTVKQPKEKAVERYLVAKVKESGGRAVKLYERDDPDRECRFMGGKLVYVEVKRPGEKLRPGQLRRHAELWKMGFAVMVIDNKEVVDALVRRFSKR